MTDLSSKHAGGWPALQQSMKALAREKAFARGASALLRMNQPDGFDCPGCAWPDPAHASSFEFCENGVKAIAAEATTRRADADFFAANPVNALRAQSDRELELHGRLTQPMILRRGESHLQPVSWDDAFSLVGDALRKLDDPDRAVLYTSGRTSNEAAFLYQLLGRVLGTNNFPDCSNMCHESSGTAMTEAIGIGKGTVTLEDFEKADAIFVIGQNPGTNHPRMLSELQAAAKRGARVVAINPLKERGLCAFLHPQDAGAMITNRATSLSDTYVQPLIGGDLALLRGIIKMVLQREDDAPGTILDHAFIDTHTTGFESFAESAKATPWSEIEQESGVGRAQIETLAEIYLEAKAVIVCWAMGVTQQLHGVATIQEILNLLMLRGHLGRPGAGACPVRGHSNVQGDRTVGITERPADAFLDALATRFDFTPPRGHGHDVVAAIDAMHADTVDVFIGMGGNFLRATPDTPHVAAAFQRVGLAVHVATRLNHTHLVDSEISLILPCLGRSETDLSPTGKPQSVSVEDSMSMVHLSAGRNRPASPTLRSEPAIVAGIAQAAWPDSSIDWRALAADYDRIRDAIADVIPAFKDFNTRVRNPGGFYLGNSARDRSWNTAAKKAVFTTTPLPSLALPSDQLRLMTIRSHDQYNTTVYTNNDRYRGIYGNRLVVFMNADDVAARNLRENDLVTVTAVADDRPRAISGIRVVPYDIPAGCVAMYFPEANVLVPAASIAHKSRTPVSKFIPVRIQSP